MPEDTTTENAAATPAATNDVPEPLSAMGPHRGGECPDRRRRGLAAGGLRDSPRSLAALRAPARPRSAPKTTRTAQGIPGDPLNVGLIGTEEEVIQAMIGLGWDAADPVTAESSIRIAGSVVRDRPYADAPVSSLFVFGRKQDLAFEKPVGASASRRHHVRFWNSTELGRGGDPSGSAP